MILFQDSELAPYKEKLGRFHTEVKIVTTTPYRVYPTETE